MLRILFEFLLFSTLLSICLLQNEDWNPFDDKGRVYRMSSGKNNPNIKNSLKGKHSSNTTSDDMSTSDGVMDTSSDSTESTPKMSTTTTTTTRHTKSTSSLSTQSVTRNATTNGGITHTRPVDTTIPYYENFLNVPAVYRNQCIDKFEFKVYVASNVLSGRYCLLMGTIIPCMLRTNRSNHSPVVDWIKDPDARYVLESQNSGLRMGTETHIFTNFFVCSFAENMRIRCESKNNRFPALAEIIPTSSFSFVSPDDDEQWILVVDSIAKIDGKNQPIRYFIENGKTILGNVTQEYERNATAVYLRHRNYVEGYTFVNRYFYKFVFLTETETDFSHNREILTMLWGTNPEFIGCPKALCEASVVDTVVKLKDNKTYIFVSRYYWVLSEGVTIDKAKYIESDNPLDTHFPYLASYIDCSFYDIEKDEVYLFKGQYVYSFTNTDAIPPDSLTLNLYGVHMSQVFPGLPYDMNAALFYRPNSTVYFFREFHYWAYDLRQKTVLNGYPRPVTDFQDMPANIDAIYSDNSGKYYVFVGTFFAEFTEEEFTDRVVRLEFKVSNVEFFGCNESYFDDYKQYKNSMQTKFAPISAQTFLDLTDDEGLDIHEKEQVNIGEPVVTVTSAPKRKVQSFLTTFANLVIYGPFFYQLFTDETPHKSKQTIFEAFEE